MGDKVSKGSPILELEAKDAMPPAPQPRSGAADRNARAGSASSRSAEAPGATAARRTVPVPDIGDFKEVEVIEVLVKPGDAVAKEQSLITLESDKATMEIPSPSAGVVQRAEDQGRRQGLEGLAHPRAFRNRGRRRPRRERGSRREGVCGHARTCAGAFQAGGKRACGGTRARAAPGAEGATARKSARSRTPALRCASSRASSASTCTRSRAAGPRAAFFTADVQAFVKGALAEDDPTPLAAKARRCACRSICRPGRKSTSPSSARWRRSRFRASRSCRGPICTATGSRFRTSRSSTRPTSRTSRLSARRRPPRPRRRDSS